MTNEIVYVVVVVAASLLSWGTAQGGKTYSAHLCPMVSSAAGPAGHDVRLTFLHRAPLGNLVLYVTVWTEDGRLVRCSLHSDPSITGEYLSLCERKPRVQVDAAVRRFNISTLLSRDDNPCTPAPPAGGSTTRPHDPTRRRTSEVKSRRRRAWIFPGTLWCGAGSRAKDYNQLGK